MNALGIAILTQSMRQKAMYNDIGLFQLIAIHPHGRAIISSEGSKFMFFFNEFLGGKNRFLMKS